MEPNRNAFARSPLGVPVRRGRLERVPSRGSVATHRALFAPPSERHCDLCAATIVGDDGGSGLYLWTRGDEVRFEEPPLCARCGPSIAQVAARRWDEEDEEEG
ncbi:MAG: hypothetical protein NVSMB47_12120 [Polyangiales bacterium]